VDLPHEERRWDRDLSCSSANEWGPGIYWTSNIGQASGYGRCIHVATLYETFKLVPDKKPTMAALTSFYRLASTEDKVRFVSDWDGLTYPEILKKYSHQDTLYDALCSLYGDLFKNATAWVTAMRDSGYDGTIRKLENGTRHLVVWSPKLLRIREL
jgi:hypothetical protein